MLKMKADPRVGRIVTRTLNDTPITMVRNRFVEFARQEKCHLLMMVDSDQSPLLHQNEDWYQPFWDVAFDAIYDHYGKGPLVVGAPYGGPPNGTENVYVFRWDNHGDRGDETTIRLEQFTRHEASKMRGLSPVAALPTGLILYDMRAFNLIEPSALSREEVLEKFASGEMTKTQALAAMQEGWFAYEWKTGHASEKASTEDVQNTRDISLVGQTQLGYNPVLCAWNSWIGHWKPWNVGRPKSFGVEHISGTFRRAVEEGRSERTITVDFSRHFPQPVKRCDTPTPVACQ